MKLYMVPAAPNPTKVMLYTGKKGDGSRFGVEQIVVNTLKGKHKEPEHLARNPWHIACSRARIRRMPG